MELIKKNFGFGLMRLPMNGEEVDIPQTCEMVDMFIENGFNYFDTAHGYLDGKSETAFRECVAKRYTRDKFIITNKLTEPYFKSESDIRPFLESQLKACGVEYFDFYLMHAQDAINFEHFKKCRAYETAFALKAEGKIRHVGISFHDTADVLERILNEYPQIEIVQIQFNYLDYDSLAVQSRLCYEVCRKYEKPVIVMEPVKGGNLVNLPDKARKVIDELGGGSPASYAIRFAAGFDGIVMTLSGMSNIEQMMDNLSFMKDFKPLDEREKTAVKQVMEIFTSLHTVQCTSCRYCVAGCPKEINIPDHFSCLNIKKLYNDWNAAHYYREVISKHGGKASDCIECGKCEKACPQHLNIRELLKDVVKEFEK